MKKLLLLIASIPITLIAFSQIDTTKKRTITITQDIARQIVKDIIRKDSLESEVQFCKSNTSLLQENIKSKDFIISIKNEELKQRDTQIVNLNYGIILKDTQNKNLQKNIDDLNMLLKKANRKLVTRTVIGGAIITGLTYLILKR